MRLAITAALFAATACSAAASNETDYSTTHAERSAVEQLTTIAYDFWMLAFDPSRLATSSGTKPVPLSISGDFVQPHRVRVVRIQGIRCVLNIYTAAVVVPCGRVTYPIVPYYGWPPHVRIEAVR